MESELLPPVSTGVCLRALPVQGCDGNNVALLPKHRRLVLLIICGVFLTASSVRVYRVRDSRCKENLCGTPEPRDSSPRDAPIVLDRPPGQ